MLDISRSSFSVPLGERAAMSVSEAATYIGVGRTKVRELIAQGRLDSAKIGDRRLVIRASIDRFLASLNA